MKNFNKKIKQMINKNIVDLHSEQSGSFSYWLIFIVLAIILMALFVVTIPLLQTIDSEFYKAAGPLLDKQQANLAYISDANVRQAMQDNIDSQRNSIPNQITILSTFFQYAWIIIIVIIVIVIFLLARRNVEAGIIG